MPQTDRTKCLLVDDVEAKPHRPEALLQRDGWQILKAQSGPEALVTAAGPRRCGPLRRWTCRCPDELF